MTNQSQILSLTATLHRSVLPPSTQPQLAYALVEIVPNSGVANVRMPLNLALALDRSGSMAIDGRIRCLRQAVEYLIDQLAPDDYISVTTFIKSADVIVASQPARDRHVLKRKANQVDTENIPASTIQYWKTHPVASATDALPAFNAAIAEAKKAQRPDRLSRVILLTDGELMNENDMIRAARRAGNDGLPVIALGVGVDWNDALMQSIAQESGGTADYIARPGDILPLFQNAVTSLQATVAQNAMLSIGVSAMTQVRKVWRVFPSIVDLGNASSIALGDLEKNNGQTLLFELLIPPRTPGNYRLAQLQVTYDVPALGVVGDYVVEDVVVAVSQDADRYPINSKVINTAERVTAFRLQTSALQDAQAGNVPAATQKLRSAATMLSNQGETDLARTLRLEADQLQQSGAISPEGSKTIKFKSGKTQRL